MDIQKIIENPLILGFLVRVFEGLSPETKEKLIDLAIKKITEYVAKNS